MQTARWDASKCVSGYEEKTAGDDGVRGEGAWALAPVHYLRSTHRARSTDALQILPWPGASAQRIQQWGPSPHRTPSKTPRLPVPGWHVQRSRIETSPRVEIRRSAMDVVATGDCAKRAYGHLWIADEKPACRDRSDSLMNPFLWTEPVADRSQGPPGLPTKRQLTILSI